MSIKIKTYGTSQLNLLHQQSLKVGSLATEDEIKTQALQRGTAKSFFSPPNRDTELLQHTQKNNKNRKS